MWVNRNRAQSSMNSMIIIMSNVHSVKDQKVAAQ